MVKKPTIPNDVPDLDLSNPKVREAMGQKPVPVQEYDRASSLKKIVAIPLQGEEVELFMNSYRSSTAKSEKDFAKEILLNHFVK